jgi:hypothetical protein
MPVVQSRFAPPWWLANCHIQTILPAILPCRAPVGYARERLELADGDFLDLDSIETGSSRILVISHGLEGSSGDGYVMGLASVFAEAGWDVTAWNYRGCSGEPNRLARSYHSGDTDDLASVIEHVRRAGRAVALAGFSLGGNLTLKFVGERPDYPDIIGAVGISAPVDLASSARKLDQDRGNQFYLRRLIRRLEVKIRAKAVDFPHHVRVEALEGVKGFSELDDRFTAPLHGFRRLLEPIQRATIPIGHPDSCPASKCARRPVFGARVFPLSGGGGKRSIFAGNTDSWWTPRIH